MSAFTEKWKDAANDRDTYQRSLMIASALLEGRNSLLEARIALLAEPGPEFVSAFMGIILAGGCAIVLSPLHPAAESRYFCEDGEVKYLLVSRSLLAQADPIAGGRKVLVIEEILGNSSSTVLSGLPKLDDTSPALQLYTSGTTGKPKGAVLSHGNLSTQQGLLANAWGLKRDDVLLHILPLHHMHGLCISLLSVLGAGGSVRFIAPFAAEKVWEEMARSTVFMAVPTIYSKLFAAFDSAPGELQARWASNAKSLRLATSGSAALPVTLAERWRKVTGKIPLERFGMSELGVALSNPLNGERKPGSVGRPLPTVRAVVVDENKNPAQSGELWISGPSTFKEYYHRPDATTEAFIEFQGERFFKTGDIVSVDEDGYFRILGRASVDILKSGGYKLSALEIEEVFREHPVVDEVAVIGLPDEVWGERVIACVVKKRGQELSENELRNFAKTKLASYKVPKQVLFLESLPRNALGKVIKPELARVASRLLSGTPPNQAG